MYLLHNMMFISCKQVKQNVFPQFSTYGFRFSILYDSQQTTQFILLLYFFHIL